MRLKYGTKDCMLIADELSYYEADFISWEYTCELYEYAAMCNGKCCLLFGNVRLLQVRATFIKNFMLLA